MVPRSAIYFSRTPEVDEFLKEFIRVRTWLVYQRERSAAAADTNGPHRRVINQDGDFLEAVDKDVDDFLSVAKEMITGTSIHLDAFITLSVSYDDMLQQIDSQSWKKLKPTKFQLDKVMKNAKVEERKRCSIPPSDDLKSVLREAEERRYQRLVADIREQLNDKPIRLSQAKPPIIGGMNVIFGVTLTFIGGFSIAGVLGAKEIIHKVIVGIACSFVALIVDTILFLMHS